MPSHDAPAGCLTLSSSPDMSVTLSFVQVLRSIKPTLALVPVYMPVLVCSCPAVHQGPDYVFIFRNAFPDSSKLGQFLHIMCSQRIPQCTFLAPSQLQVPNWFWSPQVVYEGCKGKLHDCLTSIIFPIPGAKPVFEDWLNKNSKRFFWKRKNHLS